MSALSLFKSLFPRPVKQFIKSFRKQNRLIKLVAPNLPNCICIDVGASYYPHGKWSLFLESKNTQWIAVEPNEKNLGYIQSWVWPSKVKTVTTGLSCEGGIKTLYVTNVDSGSSLLQPVITESMKHRIKEGGLAYFFPMRTVEINTISLADVIAKESTELPVFVKLDTQGTELSILQGAHLHLENKRILGIEMESTLLTQPLMQGSGKFWEACEYLERMGFELLDIFPIRAPTNLDIKSPKGKRYLNECDAVFALRRDIANTLPVDSRVALLGFYVTNRLFEEALSILEEDADVRAHFSSREVSLEELKQLILGLA